MKTLSCILTLAALCLTQGIQAESQTLEFGGKKYHLASTVVGKEDAITHEYVPVGETLQSWTSLIAVRQWPKVEKVGDAAAPWLRMVRPLLTKKVELYKSEGAKGDDILFEAWLSAPDRSYLEINLHRFVKEEGSDGIKAYQYAEKIVMKDGEGDPSSFMKNRTQRFNELTKLKLTAHEKK